MSWSIGMNLRALAGGDTKKFRPSKMRWSPQIKSRGPDLRAPAGVALKKLIWS
jgi:hypothetical protein